MRGVRELNREQRKAVESVRGKVLVLAGAGSGKTSVLIHRCVYLMESGHAAPSEILGLTFTNKAAEEMRSRIAKEVGKEKAALVTLSTFHSFCLSLLKKEIHHLGYTKQFSIYDEKDSERVLQTVEVQLTAGTETKVDEEKLKKEFDRYMKTYNAVNFDGLLSLTLELFEKFPEILAKYQEIYKFVMIDEYQDTNDVQFKLADLISQKYGNLFVVGDDDQSIYSWRGARIEHILSFPSDIKVKLEQNYRSTQPILDAANAVIAKNTKRHEKSLWSANDLGDAIRIFHAPNEEHEAEAVVKRILSLKKEKNLAWRDFAILYRSNNLSRPFEIALMKATHWDKDRLVRGIPYHVIQGMEFYARAEVKDFLSYLKVLSNPRDQTALLRIINYPRRGISIKTIEMINEEALAKKVPFWNVLQNSGHLALSPQAHKGIEQFLDLLSRARKTFNAMPLSKAMEWLASEISFKEAIHDEVKSDKARLFKWENILTLMQMGEGFNEGEDTLGDFLSSAMLDQVKASKKGDYPDRVNLLTFHSAKGLEFTACFLVGIEDRYLPHEKALLEGGLEEERRLFYVALTRAKKYLTLSMAQKRTSHGKEKPTNPSRFLFEIPKPLILIESFEHPNHFNH